MSDLVYHMIREGNLFPLITLSACLSAYPDPEDEKLLEEELNTPADSKRYGITLLSLAEIPGTHETTFL